MSNEDPTVTITSAKIGFVLSLLTLAGVIFTSASVLMEARFRITALEMGQASLMELNQSLVAKVDALNVSLNDFNLILRELQVKQRALE